MAGPVRGVSGRDVPVEGGGRPGLVPTHVTHKPHLPLAPGDPGRGLQPGQSLVAELTLTGAVLVTERLGAGLTGKRSLLGVSDTVLLQVSRGEELFVTLRAHVRRSVHPHVGLQVERVGQTLPAQLALEAPRGGVPAGLVVTQT